MAPILPKKFQAVSDFFRRTLGRPPRVEEKLTEKEKMEILAGETWKKYKDTIKKLSYE
jgi:hypothetical protein